MSITSERSIYVKVLYYMISTMWLSRKAKSWDNKKISGWRVGGGWVRDAWAEQRGLLRWWKYFMYRNDGHMLLYICLNL